MVAELLGLGWGQGILSALSADLSRPTGLPNRPACPQLSVCGAGVWVKAQTDIYMAGLSGWVKWGWVALNEV